MLVFGHRPRPTHIWGLTLTRAHLLPVQNMLFAGFLTYGLIRFLEEIIHSSIDHLFTMEDRQGEEQWKGSNLLDFLFQDGTLSQVEYDLLDEEDEDEEEVTYSDGEEYESAEDGEGEDEQREDAEEREHREPEEINTVPASITCRVNTIVAQGPLIERVVSFCVCSLDMWICVVASCLCAVG